MNRFDEWMDRQPLWFQVLAGVLVWPAVLFGLLFILMMIDTLGE